MSVTQLSGFDTQHVLAEAIASFGTVSAQNSVARNSGYALSASAAQSYVQYKYINENNAAVARFRSTRFYLRIATLPGAECVIARVSSTTDVAQQELRLSTTGQLILAYAGTVRATSGSTLTTGVWYRIEWDCGWNTGVTGQRVYVDGVSFASTTLDTIADGFNEYLGVITNTTGSLYFDDVVFDDATLAVILSYDYRVILHVPVSDVSSDIWTGGAGGTTNLYDALNNTPPVGVTTPGTDTSQVRTNYPGAGNQPIYTANMQSYSTVGLVSGDHVHAVVALVVHAEEEATGTKSVDLLVASNPAGSALATRCGHDSGAGGTFPTNWRPLYSGAVNDPTVTLATQPTVTHRRTDTGVRYNATCGLYLYTFVVPGVTVTLDVTSDASIILAEVVIDVTSSASIIRLLTTDVTSEAALSITNVITSVTSDAALTVAANTSVTSTAAVALGVQIDVTSTAALAVIGLTDVTSSAAVSVTATSDVTSTAAVSVTATVDMTSTAALSVAGLVDVTSDASLVVTGEGVTDVTTSAVVVRLLTTDVTTDVSIIFIESLDVTSNAVITLGVEADITTDAAFLMVETEDVTSSASVVLIGTSNVPSSAVITMGVSTEVSSDAALSVTGLFVSVVTSAAIEASISKNVPTTAALMVTGLFTDVLTTLVLARARDVTSEAVIGLITGMSMATDASISREGIVSNYVGTFRDATLPKRVIW